MKPELSLAADEASSFVLLPQGFPLFQASLVRSGQDLQILGPSGESALIGNYFVDGSALPALARAGGGFLAGDLVASLTVPAGHASPGQPAHPVLASVVGRIADLTGAASVMHSDGFVESLDVADAIHQGDYVFPTEGALTIVFADGTRLTIQDGGQVLARHVTYDPASISGAIELEAAGGRFELTVGNLGEQPGRPIKVGTPMARIQIGAGSVAFQHDAALGLDVELLDDVILQEDALIVDNAAGWISSVQAGGHITVYDDQQAPLLAVSSEHAAARSVEIEAPTALSAVESTDGVEVSPGGDENALPGDPIVVSGTPAFFNLSPQPAPLESPSLLEPTLAAVDVLIVKHDTIAPASEAVQAPESPGEAGEQLRDWEPLGLVWDVLGSAMVTANAPALPYETDGRQIICTDKLSMAGLALSPDQRSTGELDVFLGLAGGSIATTTPGTTPADGSAIRAKLSLAAGSELSFDFFFDAGDTEPRNDFAVFSIGTHVYQLSDVVGVGTQGATGWRTFVYKVAQSGTYTIGFASVNDELVDNLSALYVDNVRINRAFGSDYVVLETTEDGAGRILVLPPVLRDDVLVTNEDALVVTSEATLLANDQANDSFISLKIVSFDTTGLLGHLIFGPQTGRLSYDPGREFDSLAEGETASDSFKYLAKTGEGVTANGTVLVSITGVNDAPVATGSALWMSSEDGGPLDELDVLANDDDVDSDDSSATLRIVAAQATRGIVSFTGAPGAGLFYLAGSAFDFLGAGKSVVDTITYTITDRYGAQSTATETVTITGVNDAPVARADSGSAINADTVLKLDVLANDSDPDTDDTIRVEAVFGPASGAQVTINQDGSLTYDPRGHFDSLTAGQTTTDTFGYRIGDGYGGTADAMATIAIIGVNDAPVAVGDVAGTGATTRLTLSAAVLVANDTDVDNGDTLHLAAVDGTGTIGHVSLQGGSVVYDAGPDFVWLGEGETAVDSFRYVVADTAGGFATGTVLVSVTGVNDPVTAVDDIVSANEDDRLVVSAAGVLTNDHDLDLHDVLGVVAVDGQAADVGQPITLRSGAQVTVFASGRVEYDPGSVWSWLSVGETGSDQVSYTVADGHGSVSTGQLTIVVSGMNDLPVAAADEAVADEDARVRIGALANDSDPDLHDALIIRSVILEAPDGTNTHGTVRINPDNTLTYDPEGQFDYLAPGETATDVFQYIIDDGHGGRDVKTVTVTVHGVDDPRPVPDQELLDSFEVPAQGALVVPGATANFGVEGTAALQAAFVPTDDFGHPLLAFSSSHLGKMMVLTAAGSSGAGGSGVESPIEVFLNLPGNALPDNFDKSANTGAATRVEVALTDSDAADGKIELSFDWNFVANASDRPAGTINDDFAVFTVTDGVTWKVLTLSDAVRTDWGSSGWRTSVYDVTHDFAVTPGSTLTLTVGFAVLNDATPNNPSHLLLDNVRLDRPLGPDFEPDGPADGGLQTYRQAPTALPDASATSEDAPLALSAASLLANDFQAHGIDRSTLHIVGVDAQSARGAIIAFDGTQMTYDPRGPLDALSVGETVADVFHYTITDGNGGTDQGQVTVTLTGVNDAPVAVGDFAADIENGPEVAIDVLANDDDIDSDDDRSTLRIVAASASSGVAIGIAAGAVLLYDSNATTAFESLGLGETAIDTITYTIEDRHGLRSSSTVQVTVSGSNDAPRAVDDTGSIDENTVLTLSVMANDSDPDAHDILRISAISTVGTLGHVTVNADGTLSYDPTSGFNGLARGQTATDTFSYTASDGHGGTSQASVTVSVTGLNDAPQAVGDTLTTTAAAARTVAASTLLANDTDPDGGDAIHVPNVDATSAHGGTVSFNGTSITYDPAGHFRSLGEGETAQDTFHYRVADLDGATGDGTVTVTIQGVNDAPLAVNDIATTDEDNSVKVQVRANDSDPDTNDFLSIASINTTGTRGQVTINVADGTITYDPRGQFDYLNAGQSAHDTFVYRIADGHGGFDDATVDVTITGKPDSQSLVTSFETPFGLNDYKGTVTRPASYQEADGGRGLYHPTDASVMARLDANGALIPALNTHLGLPANTIPKDSVDNTSPANGSAIKLSVTVQAGDQISFDWMFDARDYTRTPPDGNQDNDFALFTVSGGSAPETFRLADVRSTGDLGATGWRSSIYTAPVGGQLTIGMASINDRIAADNSVLLVDNVRINRDFGEGYQVVDIQAGGRFETVVHT